MDKKIWGILLHLGVNIDGDYAAINKLEFDRSVWNKLVDKCVEKKLNTIILDVEEGMIFNSHPELAAEGAWTQEEVKSEVCRLRELGIELVPKLNFSAMHDAWLGIYERMISTPLYYQVCKDLIEEVYTAFDSPSYIHIGMDEENWKHAKDGGSSMVIIRNRELYINDIIYLSDCVKNLGAKCHLWVDPFTNYSDYAHSNLPLDLVPNAWNYYEYERDRWTLISEQSQEVRDFYAKAFVERYGYTIEYVEESPHIINIIKEQKKFLEQGRHFIMASSSLYIDTCEEGAVLYAKKICPDLSLIDGFITCPWTHMKKENEELMLKHIEHIGNAKELLE